MRKSIFHLCGALLLIHVWLSSTAAQNTSSTANTPNIILINLDDADYQMFSPEMLKLYPPHQRPGRSEPFVYQPPCDDSILRPRPEQQLFRGQICTSHRRACQHSRLSVIAFLSRWLQRVLTTGTRTGRTRSLDASSRLSHHDDW